MATSVIYWTPELIADLADKLEYHERIDSFDTDTFMFHGRELYIGYAKYLLEHLRSKRGVK